MESLTLETPRAADQGIEILVELAKSGQIDPWHIDVVDVTDKFLRTLDVTKETDLRLSGRCLFYAAVLLRLKSEAMEEEEESLDVEYEVDDESETLVIRPASSVLDASIARRKSMKQPRTRPTTLVELIAELQRLEAQEREGTLDSDNALRRTRPAEENTVNIHHLTHEEDVEGEINRLSAMLGEWLIGMGVLTLEDVLTHCPDTRGTFLALLFLDSRGKITLHQDTFYGEMTIVPEELDAHGQDRAA